jgi:hypothetical protein
MAENRIDKEGFSKSATDEFSVDFLNRIGTGFSSEANVQLRYIYFQIENDYLLLTDDHKVSSAWIIVSFQ